MGDDLLMDKKGPKVFHKDGKEFYKTKKGELIKIAKFIPNIVSASSSNINKKQ